MRKLRLVLWITASAALVGCVDGGPLDEESGGERGGKADDYLYGSCAESCEDQSSSGNCWCDSLCVAYDDCCADKVAICDVAFEKFRISHTGFCAPEVDCNGFMELSADGTLRVDRLGETPATIHEARVADADLYAAIAVLADPALVEILDLGEPPCSQPTDVYEGMLLVADGAEHRNSTTFCDLPELEAARQALSSLVETYLPETVFEKFKISHGGFCPPEYDCSGFMELDAEGKLRVDRTNELPATVYEAYVSETDLQRAIEVLTDPALIELLDREEPPCVQPSGVHEYMALTAGGVEHGNSTTFCDIPAIEAARETLSSLAAAYLPE